MSAQDYIQQPIEEEGVYRAFPVTWTIEKSTKEDSQSTAIAFQFAVTQKWHGKEAGWSQEYPPGYYTENRTWIIKKDGLLNDAAIAALAKCGLWDGDFDRLGGPPASVYVLVDVQAETYEGKTRYRAAWVNPNADEPVARGGFQPADTKLLASLRARFQGQTRAIAGGGATGAPAAPPATTRPTAAMPQHATPMQAQMHQTPMQQPTPAAQPQQAARPTPATQPMRPSPIVQPMRPSPMGPPAQQFVAPPATGAPDDPIDPDQTPF